MGTAPRAQRHRLQAAVALPGLDLGAHAVSLNYNSPKGGPAPGYNRPAPGYNRMVRIPAVLLLIVSLAACSRAPKNNDAVRQGVVDYLVSKGFDVPKTMTVNVTNV